MLISDTNLRFAVTLESVLHGHEGWIYSVRWHPPVVKGIMFNCIKGWHVAVKCPWNPVLLIGRGRGGGGGVRPLFKDAPIFISQYGHSAKNMNICTIQSIIITKFCDTSLHFVNMMGDYPPSKFL